MAKKKSEFADLDEPVEPVEAAGPFKAEKVSSDGDGGAAEVQAKMDEATDKGFHGVNPDPTPNANYTVAGVVAGLPTPENNAGQAKKAQAASGLGGTKFDASEKEAAEMKL